MAAILVLTGASGAGKSSLAQALDAQCLPGVGTFACDSRWEELPEQIRADGERAQDALLEYGVRRALAQPLDVAVLDTQIRPHKAQALLRRLGVAVFQVVLVECEQDEREARLRGPRAQPELANPQMRCWAAYLRGQADVLGLPVIDTSSEPPAESAARLREIVTALRQRIHPAACGRLVVLCGLPGAGKTTRALELAAQTPGAVRLNADEWMQAAGLDLWDSAARHGMEAGQWELARHLLAVGRTVIIDWGTWGRGERDKLRLGARQLGARVELHYLDAPAGVLFERIRQRNMERPPIRREDLERWAAQLEPPSADELALFDSAE